MLFLPLIALAQGGATAPGAPLLVREPTLSATTIVFRYAGDLWTVPREGGHANRLTSAQGVESHPHFSPDGKLVAFTGQYDGNADVFVVPVEGGVPKRLTAHPSPEIVAGWTPDGKSVIFTSGMLSETDSPRLFTVSVNGGVPKPLPFPSGSEASLSPDGTRVAYNPGWKWEPAWKRYRGGQTYPLWIAQLSDSHWKEVPRHGENQQNPMWVGDKVYFLSDKTGPVGLCSYDTKSGKVADEIKGEGFDIKSADAGPGAIVYAKLDSLNLYDLASHTSKRVPVEITGDFPEVRPQFKDLRTNVTSSSISPNGQRVVVAARGWIFTVPASKGDAHQLSEKQGVHRRVPVWSPDSKSIAYFTDERGPQEIAIFDLATSKERFISIGDVPQYYNWLTWSPDSSKIAYVDYGRHLWLMDVPSGKSTLVDKGLYHDPTEPISATFSPDSKWMAWNRDLDNHLNAVFVYDIDKKVKTQITDGLANAKNPVFDRDGKHMYFYASTNTGWAASWLDMTSLSVPNVTSAIYAVVLRNDGPDPLQPESDEDNPKDPAKAPEKKDDKFRIDLDGIQQRVVALPMPVQNYQGLEAGPPGTLFALTAPNRANSLDFGGLGTIQKFSMATRSAAPFAPGVTGMEVSGSGSHILLKRGPNVAIVPTAAPAAAPGQGAVDFSGLRAKIEPRQEWRSMFAEVWKNEPILLYDPNLHGIKPAEMVRRYSPFLEGINSRDDLSYLFEDMTGEISIGHMWVRGGDIPGTKSVPGGLLGADYAFENGRYRITRVYNGESWNPGLAGPLSKPGVSAKAGEYLLSIDGRDLNDAMDIYEALEGKAGRQVKVKIGPTPNGVGAREATVVPVGNDTALRQIAWKEDNRRKVEQLSGGRLGYVHIPDTGQGGWESFQRYYYAQTGKDGIIVDERFNQGGLINDFMVLEMQRTMNGVFTSRYGKDWPTPGVGVFGPKVMITNQYGGSGGDMFPWLFKFNKVGPIVGKRTWGGLVASFGFPLIDGGFVNAPDDGFYNPHNNTWDVEGHGVDPDMEVELDPYLWRQGHDAQLEKAVEEAMKLVRATPKKTYSHPPYVDKTKVGG
ncbi:S41 family peptidase [Fimbriimonas ginsengisoli]|uniref:Tricorn protease homolog n=1 Tax=Fimbriimonas ginsengisoli Gsoil 348 TaxID=661478 RepID=A0A068NTF4_FIMGI|nr:S41 family peptidase [Fimbriimonas ginsengisoli]AIE86833.1 TolB protein precursor [Fimbriimonas ginsengisoli Gsoil 348]